MRPMRLNGADLLQGIQKIVKLEQICSMKMGIKPIRSTWSSEVKTVRTKTEIPHEYDGSQKFKFRIAPIY